MSDYRLHDYKLFNGSIYFYASKAVASKDPEKLVEIVDTFLGYKDYNSCYHFNTDTEKFQDLLLKSKYAVAYRCWQYSINCQRKCSNIEPLKTREEQEKEKWRKFAEDRYWMDQMSDVGHFRSKYEEGFREGRKEVIIEYLKKGCKLAVISDIFELPTDLLEKFAILNNISLDGLTKGISELYAQEKE